MVQSKGSRGLRLASAVAAPLNFPASQIFTNCYYFPSEFSLVATVKIQTLRQKVMQRNGAGSGPVWSSSAQSGPVWISLAQFSPLWTSLFQSNVFFLSLLPDK